MEYFLASPPDVQLDWNALMMVQEHDVDVDHHSDSSHSHSPNTSSSSSAERHAQRQPMSVVAAQDNYKCHSSTMREREREREMVFRMAAMQPAVHIEPESLKAPKRRNVRISKDPQSAAARRRRERISERMRMLQRLVPGGTKMDTASMLDEAVHYLKFLKAQVTTIMDLRSAGFGRSGSGSGIVTTGHARFASAGSTTSSYVLGED